MATDTQTDWRDDIIIALERDRNELVAALKAHDEYMLASGYSGPDSDALHPKAAENWKRIRAVLSKSEA